MPKFFEHRILFAIVTLVVCVTPCFCWQDDSWEMDEYAKALKSEARRKDILRHPPKTSDDRMAALSSSDVFIFPSLLSQFGIGLFEGLAKVRSNGKVGYINKAGKIEFPAKFGEGGRFSEGLARVRTGEKWGFIDRTGRLVIAPRFSWACSFYEGRALVRVGDKWGYIDKHGKIAISPRFDEASSFLEGLAAVQLYKDKYKTGYIDIYGRWILPPAFDGGSDFHEGVAIVGKDVGYNNGVIVQEYVISKTGRRLFDLNSWYLSSYSEGHLIVANNEREFGYLDLTGRLVIPHRFESANSFSEGLASVRVNDKWVYIDKQGRVVLRTEDDCNGYFSHGLAPCDGNGKAGFIDRTGKFVIEPKFDWVGAFHEELAPVIVGDKVGYINTKGQYVWRPTD